MMLTVLRVAVARLPSFRSIRSLVTVALIVASFSLISGDPTTVALAASTTYYVDCTNGNDAFGGTTQATAWKSLIKANAAALYPGDRLMLKRGCAWKGPLIASWNGTAGNPIVVTAYGTGNLPIVQNTVDNVKITGSYLVVEYIHARADALSIDPNCANQPVGWRSGFLFGVNAHHNTLRYSKARELTVGVLLSATAHHNKVFKNQLVDNTYMSVNTNNGGVDDSGAWGMVINGNDNEISYNYFSNNRAWCSYDFGSEGAAIEIYKGQRNAIHHNTSINDSTFSELGGDATVKAESNTFAYNLYYSTLPSSFFVTLRGVKSPLGPTRQTRVLNNTIYLSGTRRTEGVSCSAGCSPDILIMYNNILNVAMKPVFADAPFNEGNNLYWADNGNPWVDLQGFLMSPTSRIGDPRFVDLATQNLRLSSASPAINMGALTTVWNGYKVDLDNSPVPSGGIPDAGVYEYATTTTSAALVACDGEFGATCAGEFLCSPDSNACDTPPPCDIGWSYICDTPAPCIVGNEPSCSPPLVACDPTTQACYYTMLPLVSK